MPDIVVQELKIQQSKIEEQLHLSMMQLESICQSFDTVRFGSSLLYPSFSFQCPLSASLRPGTSDPGAACPCTRH